MLDILYVGMPRDARIYATRYTRRAGEVFDPLQRSLFLLVPSRSVGFALYINVVEARSTNSSSFMIHPRIRGFRSTTKPPFTLREFRLDHPQRLQLKTPFSVP
ncbi:hypothetical protein PM082_020949 [Marasmius tenuissimus]|nr:hypothetical protein PM082_020949 [Marasmius tenuissimus]